MNGKIETKNEVNGKRVISIEYEKFYALYSAFAKAKFNVTTGINQFYLFTNAHIYTKELIEKMEKGESVSIEDLKAAVSGLKSIVLLMLDFLLNAEKLLEENVDEMLKIIIEANKNN
jgi:hypothetical protein